MLLGVPAEACGLREPPELAVPGHIRPEPARDADAAAAGIALSTVAGTVAANYQPCHENAEQLRALQTWVREMASAIK